MKSYIFSIELHKEPHNLYYTFINEKCYDLIQSEDSLAEMINVLAKQV